MIDVQIQHFGALSRLYSIRFIRSTSCYANSQRGCLKIEGLANVLHDLMM